MNIIRYLSNKIKSKLKKFKLYTATVILTVTTATAGVLTACTSKTNNNNSAKNTTEVVTEVPEEKENTMDSLIKMGIILEQETSYPDYYKIVKSSTNNVSNGNSTSSINDYFDEKGIVPYYDAKCSPKELVDLMSEAETGFDGLKYGNMPLGSALAYNNKLDNQTGKKYMEELMDIIYNYKGNDITAPREILAYNLLNLEIKEVYEDKEYYSRFDPIDNCIYMNLRYVDTKEKEKYALFYAIECASFDAYLDVDGKRVYCSLNNYYYDSNNDKLIEAGTTYRDDFVYNRLFSRFPDAKIDFPIKEAEKLYVFGASEILLHNGNIFGSQNRTYIRDFSTFLDSEITALKSVSQNPTDIEKFDIAEILFNADLGDIEALKKSADYQHTSYNYGSVRIVDSVDSWIGNIDSFRNEMLEYISQDENTKVR